MHAELASKKKWERFECNFCCNFNEICITMDKYYRAIWIYSWSRSPFDWEIFPYIRIIVFSYDQLEYMTFFWKIQILARKSCAPFPQFRKVRNLCVNSRSFNMLLCISTMKRATWVNIYLWSVPRTWKCTRYFLQAFSRGVNNREGETTPVCQLKPSIRRVCLMWGQN